MFELQLGRVSTPVLEKLDSNEADGVYLEAAQIFALSEALQDRLGRLPLPGWAELGRGNPPVGMWATFSSVGILLYIF